MVKLIAIGFLAIILGFILQQQFFTENEVATEVQSSSSSSPSSQNPKSDANTVKRSEESSSSLSYTEIELQYEARIQKEN